MQIYPAIDLQGGRCVRLSQGDFRSAVVYENDPVKQAQRFADVGSTWLHIVDLDGARTGKMQQFEIAAKVAASTPMKVQIGGGIRETETIQNLLDAGVERVVIGSLAVTSPMTVKAWLKQFGTARVLLAFDINVNDVNIPEVATHGWQQGSGTSLWDVLDGYADNALDSVMCTDIARDGLLAGSNVTLYQDIKRRYPTLNLIASGGVDGMEDIRKLAKAGLDGVIVGKALYEKRVDLRQAFREVNRAG